jgi:acyl dehydratase
LNFFFRDTSIALVLPFVVSHWIVMFFSVPKREHGIYEKLVSSTGTQGTSVLPCFIPALMFKVWARLTSLPQWPLNPLGMIHYKTVITQWREIKVEEPLRVEVTINGSRATERGLEIDAIIKAFDGKGERVLDCVWTVLSRGGRAGAKKTGSSAPAPAAETPVEDANTTLVEARAGLGVRFSTATGDISPQHMYGLTAMIAGFKKPIAHGMWTLERAISDIREKGAMPKYPFTIDSSFKLPIFLPGKVNVAWTQKAAGKVDFRVAAVDGKPHMLGSVAPAAK